MKLRVLCSALIAAIPTAALAAPVSLDVRASLTPSGCETTIAGSVVTITGCTASAPLAGTMRGRMKVSYGAVVDFARGQGRQRGSISVLGVKKTDVAVLRFSGSVTVSSGRSRGTWKLVRAGGALRRTMPAKGTYASRTPDQGVHVFFNVRG